MRPEEPLSALRTVASYVATFLTLQHSLTDAQGAGLGSGDYGDWQWLRGFDAEDLAEFMGDMRDAIIVAAREESSDLIEATLHRWQVTAEVLGDPLRREILLGTYRDADFVAVSRPE